MSTEVVMPQMVESMADARMTKCLKKVGNRVERDEPLFEISTDKVDAEIPSPAAGTLTEVRYKEGDTVEVNTVVAVLDGDSATKAEAPAQAPAEPPKQIETQPSKAEATPAPEPELEAFKAAPQSQKPTETDQQPVVTKPVAAPPVAQQESDGGVASADELRRTKSSPLVRKIAQEQGVDISQLEGTGLSGAVIKNHILSFIEARTTTCA